MVGVARGAEARDLGQGLRTAREGMLKGFEHHGAGAFARHETAATLIEGQRGLSRVVHLCKRAQVGETGDADGVDRLLRAARKRHIGVPVADGAHGGADVVGAGGAGGGHIDALAAHAVADGQMTCCDVADHGGHEQRADALGALIVQRVEAVLQLVDAADARTEDHRRARGILLVHVDAGLRHGLVGGNDGVLDETLEAACLLFRQPVLGGIEIAHLARHMHVEIVVIEVGNSANAAAFAHHRIPKRVNADAGGRDGAHTGDDHAVSAIGTARCGRIDYLTHSAKPPSMQMTCPVM